MLVIVGEIKAQQLFGDIFPQADYICTRRGARINVKNAVVIAKDGDVEIENAAAVIVGDNASCNFPRGVQIIVCGNGAKDAISITSRTSDKITLALNRAIRTQSGICEPLETPVELRCGFSEFDYMSAFAASLIEG